MRGNPEGKACRCGGWGPGRSDAAPGVADGGDSGRAAGGNGALCRGSALLLVFSVLLASGLGNLQEWAFEFKVSKRVRVGGPPDKHSAARGSQGEAGDNSPEVTEGFQAPRVHDADATTASSETTADTTHMLTA